MGRSEELFERAVKRIPGGVNSPVRAYGAIGIGEVVSIPTAPAISAAYQKLDGEIRHSLPLAHTPYSR